MGAGPDQGIPGAERDLSDFRTGNVRVSDQLETGERAISLHFKVYSDEPNKVWHAEEQRWHAYDLDTKIAIYADRVRGWFLDFGRRFTSEHNCGFIVLMIGVSYLEGNQQFRDGVSSRSR